MRKLAIPVILFCGVIAFFGCAREDPRTRSDKEGRFLPIWALKELAYAMHCYEKDHAHLPPAAVYGKDGIPLLSWRVLLLPYIEQEKLFREFKLDEPWDSAHNLRLLPKMPSTFSPLERTPPQEPYTTAFQVFVGKGTAFEGREGLRFKEDFPTGLSNVILIAEAYNAVPWTKPEDLAYEENQPLPKLGAFFKGYFLVALGDASVRSVRQDIKQETLRAAIIRSGNGPGNDW